MDTAALRQQYETDGFCLIPGAVLADEIALVESCIVAGVETHAQSMLADGKITELHSAESFDRRLASLYRGKKAGMRAWDEVLSPAALSGLVRSPGVIDALELVLGPDISFSGDFHLRPKLPDDTLTSFPWHQDSQYYGEPTQHLHIVTAWIPLVDVNIDNGCLWVIPGSHRWGLLGGKRGEDMNIRTFEDVEKRGAPIPVPMKRGDVLLFTNLTFHASKLNLTQTVRWSMDLRYFATPEPSRLSPRELEALAFFGGKLQAYGRNRSAVRGRGVEQPVFAR